MCYNKDVPKRGTKKEKEIDIMTKLTKKVALSYAIAVLSHSEIKDEAKHSLEDVVAKLKEMLEGLEKKSSDEKGMTENQKQNVGYKDAILNFLANHPAVTASEILRGVDSFPEEMTNQRVSALLRQLILDGKVEKKVEKGKTLFSLAQ